MPHPRTATVLPSPQSAPAWAAASTPRAPPDTTSTEARASPSARARAIRSPRSSLSRDPTIATRFASATSFPLTYSSAGGFGARARRAGYPSLPRRTGRAPARCASSRAQVPSRTRSGSSSRYWTVAARSRSSAARESSAAGPAASASSSEPWTATILESVLAPIPGTAAKAQAARTSASPGGAGAVAVTPSLPQPSLPSGTAGTHLRVHLDHVARLQLAHALHHRRDAQLVLHVGDDEKPD